MKISLKVILATALLGAVPFALAQDASSDVKKAADDTGSDTKKVADKTGHDTKVAAKDTAKGTEKAADKTERHRKSCQENRQRRKESCRRYRARSEKGSRRYEVGFSASAFLKIHHSGHRSTQRIACLNFSAFLALSVVLFFGW
jgi:hypothetical protein